MKTLLIVFFILLLPVAVFAGPSLNDRLVVMWQVQHDVTDRELAFMKEKGINIIQSFRVRLWNENEIKSYLDRAQKAGMGVIISLTGLTKRIDNVWTFSPGPGDVAFIKKWKEHPALFAWQLFDEPANPDDRISAAIQEEAYRYIKSADPQTRVYQSWNGTSEESYRCCFSEDSFDILDLHAYINDSIGIRQRKLVEEFRKHQKKTYPIVITLRADDGGVFKKLPIDGLKQQYDYFFTTNNITRNIGFYGWKLSPYRGISQVPDIMRQFKELTFK